MERENTLEQALWKAVDTLRGRTDAVAYKHIVLDLIFLRALSIRFSAQQTRLLAKGQDAENQATFQCAAELWIPRMGRWPCLKTHVDFANFGELLDQAMAAIAEANSALQHILAHEYAFTRLKPHSLAALFQIIDTIALEDAANRQDDTLGAVYEYFLGRFAALEGKSGEFYTPPAVARLMVELLEPTHGSIYDPCCGTGGMFLQALNFVRESGGSALDISVYGQELNPTTWRLGSMNLVLHHISGTMGARPADTFHEDCYPDLQADYVLANPPFNINNWGGERLRDDPRWRYGLPPADNANMAWLQHCISHMAAGGQACIVLANGCLSGNADLSIRRAIIEADLLDCVIALPGQLFANTQIAASLWLLARDKQDARYRARRGETLLIYAQSMGQYVDRAHRSLTSHDIEKIAATYQTWRGQAGQYVDQPGFCRAVSLSEIAAHRWALVPGRYVGFAHSEGMGMDWEQVRREMQALEQWFEQVKTTSDDALATLRGVFDG